MGKFFPESSPCDEPLLPDGMHTLGTALIAIENEHQETGWNQPPVLYMLVKESETGPMVVLPARLGRHTSPQEELTRAAFATMMILEMELDNGTLSEEKLQMLKKVYFRPIEAHAIVTEASVQMEGQESDNLHVRFAYMAAGAYLLAVAREKGEEPEIACLERQEDGTFILGGEMVQPLVQYDDACRLLSWKVSEVGA